MKLNPKQKLFADAYIELGSAEQAALRAGYSKAYARGNAHKLVAHVSVSEYIEEKMKEISNSRIMTQQEALELLTRIANAEITEELYIPTESGIQRIEKRPDIRDRQKAIDSILKRYPVSRHDELRNQMLEAQIEKIKRDGSTEQTTEDKLSKLFDAIEGAYYGG